MTTDSSMVLSLHITVAIYRWLTIVKTSMSRDFGVALIPNDKKNCSLNCRKSPE